MRAVIIALFAFLVAACAKPPPPVSAETKDALHAILNPQFTLKSVSEERREELYHILTVFRDSREPDEFVRSVEFTSSSEATLSFSDTGMHGGGTVVLRKKRGYWQIEQKAYFM